MTAIATSETLLKYYARCLDTILIIEAHHVFISDFRRSVVRWWRESRRQGQVGKGRRVSNPAGLPPLRRILSSAFLGYPKFCLERLHGDVAIGVGAKELLATVKRVAARLRKNHSQPCPPVRLIGVRYLARLTYVIAAHWIRSVCRFFYHSRQSARSICESV